jgi:serine/threonine protein phosphatase PrpC
VTNSGTTAILVLSYKGTLYCGSAGDSRAVIGTLVAPDRLPTKPAVMNEEDRRALSTIKRRRSTLSDVQLVAVQLTKDLKPEDPEEYVRILD